jgi:hypothetical protein
MARQLAQVCHPFGQQHKQNGKQAVQTHQSRWDGMVVLRVLLAVLFALVFGLLVGGRPGWAHGERAIHRDHSLGDFSQHRGWRDQPSHP